MTGFGLSNYVSEVVKLNRYDMLIRTHAFDDPPKSQRRDKKKRA